MRDSFIKRIDNQDAYLRAIRRIETLQEADCELMTDSELKQLSILNDLANKYEKQFFEQNINNDNQLIEIDNLIINENETNETL